MTEWLTCRWINIIAFSEAVNKQRWQWLWGMKNAETWCTRKLFDSPELHQTQHGVVLLESGARPRLTILLFTPSIVSISSHASGGGVFFVINVQSPFTQETKTRTDLVCCWSWKSAQYSAEIAIFPPTLGATHAEKEVQKYTKLPCDV